MPTELDNVLSALHRSHDRLVATVTALTGEQVTGPSYDDDWTIAQVASHLGSGAQIFEKLVDAGVLQTPAPGVEEFHPVWDTWNAKAASEQVRDLLPSDASLLARVDALTPDERARWRLDVFGEERTLAGLLGMRLAEHTLHTWDIAVALDPTATVPDDAAALVLGSLPALVARAGKGTAEPVTVHVTASGPDVPSLLELTPDGAALGPAGPEAGSAQATLRLPAEAFVRLVYGRLDHDHTPADVEVSGVELHRLRAAFPGV